jgi:hypothetical protein
MTQQQLLLTASFSTFVSLEDHKTAKSVPADNKSPLHNRLRC